MRYKRKYFQKCFTFYKSLLIRQLVKTTNIRSISMFVGKVGKSGIRGQEEMINN